MADQPGPQNNWGGYGSAQAYIQARAQQDRTDYQTDADATTKAAQQDPASYKAYQDYISSVGSFGQDVQQGFNWLSNPLGSQGLGPDNTTLTNPFGIDTTGGKGIVNAGMSYDVFRSMTDADWATFKSMSPQDQQAFLKQRSAKLGSAGQGQGGDSQQAAYDAWRTQVMGQLQQYANKMNMSVSDLVKSQDPGVMNAMAQGMRTGGAQNLAAGASGGGGLSVLNTQKAGMDSMNAYQMQRSQLGLNALNSLQGGLQQQYMNAEQRRQYEQGINMQLQQAQAASQMFQYQQAQQKQAGLFGIAGGVVGGYLGGPQGAQAGYGIGQGIGTQSYPSYKGYNYQYPSGSPQSGSGGLNPQ